ncbi:hypothetical protein H0H93_010461 [Arthromyces matolae]|nr:hypothetical protein H0H93_010461 [Arthromyces matolae]
MTYSYLLSIPLIATYSIGFTAIKYYEGFVAIPFYGIVPKPIELWTPLNRSFNLPLMLCLSVGWSLEMVTHLEELCFWLFLVNSGSTQQNWFQSPYFKTWVVGAICAVVYMPVVTALSRTDSLKRKEGVDINTIVRLTKFSELNMIRIFFRFLFTLPLLILGIDGVRPHHHINESMFWTGERQLEASLGIGSHIFFPRSIEGEIAARDERKRSRTGDFYETELYESRHEFTQTQHSTHTFNYGTPVMGHKSYPFTTPGSHNVQLDGDNLSVSDNHHSSSHGLRETARRGSMDKSWAEEDQDRVGSLPPLRPNRKKGADVELGGIEQVTQAAMASKLNPRPGKINHMVHNFTSPIDLAYTQPSGGDKIGLMMVKPFDFDHFNSDGSEKSICLEGIACSYIHPSSPEWENSCAYTENLALNKTYSKKFRKMIKSIEAAVHIQLELDDAKQDLARWKRTQESKIYAHAGFSARQSLDDARKDRAQKVADLEKQHAHALIALAELELVCEDEEEVDQLQLYIDQSNEWVVSLQQLALCSPSEKGPASRLTWSQLEASVAALEDSIDRFKEETFARRLATGMLHQKKTPGSPNSNVEFQRTQRTWAPRHQKRLRQSKESRRRNWSDWSKDGARWVASIHRLIRVVAFC